MLRLVFAFALTVKQIEFTRKAGVLHFCGPSRRSLRFECLEDRQLLTTAAVKDINVGSASSNPEYLTNVGGRLFFAANDGQTGEELWTSDGNPSGTHLVKDINPGPASSAPHSIVDSNGTLYFSAEGSTLNRELWKSDGTAEGTKLVKDIRANGSSYPYYLTNVNGIVFFSAYDGIGGLNNELWRTDGTSAGTFRVKDIRVGGEGSDPKYLTNINGVLYFRADDGIHGSELWRSDGTASGTMLVKDINPGLDSSYPYYFTAVGSKLYFQATDPLHGAELWVSDGTAEGTLLVSDIAPNSASSNPWYLTPSGGSLFFQADDGTTGLELWKTDGTATVRVKDINQGLTGSNPRYLTVAGSNVYFQANNGVTGAELWKTDGTTAGTLPVKDIRVSGSSSPKELIALGNSIFFQADDGNTGAELWRSDGTSAGTYLVQDINIGNASSSPGAPKTVGGRLFFTANDGITGVELWTFTQTSYVAAQFVFYNHSAFDGNDLTADIRDDSAIAIDKSALSPGQTATFSNYTNYSRGINGILVDLALAPSMLTAVDFEFRTGNDDNPTAWSFAPPPQSITTRPAAGAQGADRISIVWSDLAIKNVWLQVVVKATANSGLTTPYVFFFGNAVGESGNSSSNTVVNSTDEIAARNNPRTFLAPALVSFPYDYNRDGFVNATDQILARSNSTTSVNSLKLISLPAPAASAMPSQLASSTAVVRDDSDPIARGIPASCDFRRGPISSESVQASAAGSWNRFARTVLQISGLRRIHKQAVSLFD